MIVFDHFQFSVFHVKEVDAINQASSCPTISLSRLVFMRRVKLVYKICHGICQNQIDLSVRYISNRKVWEFETQSTPLCDRGRPNSESKVFKWEKSEIMRLLVRLVKDWIAFIIVTVAFLSVSGYNWILCKVLCKVLCNREKVHLGEYS